MSLRGRILFDKYIVTYLNNTNLQGLTVESHAFNLATQATAVKMPIGEIIEEVGSIAAALARAKAPVQGTQKVQS